MPRVPDNPNNRSVAAILLREGGVIAYPTDTVYGLGAVVFNRAAVSTVPGFEAVTQSGGCGFCAGFG